MSISFRLRPTTLLVAGALLVPSVAFAQDAPPSIVPTDSAPAPVPAPVASPATAPTNPQPIIDSMDFEEVEVTQLLSMISTQFDLPIAISGDVSGKLRGIHLKGKTADQALNTVIQAAQLSVQKTDDGTYIISKAPSLIAPASNPIIGTPAPVISPSTPGLGGPLTFGGNSSSANARLSPYDTGTSMFSVQSDAEPKLEEVKNGADSKERSFNVPIRNVKASLMAYWLDPANHELPVDIRIAKQLENQYNDRTLVKQGIVGGRIISDNANTGQPLSSDPFSQPFDTNGVVPNPTTGNPYLTSSATLIDTRANAQFGRGGGQGGFGGGRGGVGGRNGQNGGGLQLPEGVSRVVAVDPQNALLVFGTPEGAAKLAATIRFLDRPLRQVEIEAQFLSISTNDSSTYGFDFTSSRGNFNAGSTGRATTTAPGGLSIGFFRGNFEAAIQASVASGKAKVLTAPRVTAINNLTASLQQTTNIPVRLNTTTTVSNNGIATQTGQSLFYIQTNIGLQVTPTINNDDTITVLMQPQLTTASPPNSNGDQTFTSQTIQTIANVRDGETIALGGLRSTNITVDKTRVPLIGDIPLIGKLFRSRSSAAVESELIIFVTARILRRVGDDDAVGAGDIPVGVG